MKENRRQSSQARGRRSRSVLGFLMLCVVAFCGALGLVHILVKNKTHAIGRQQEAVEREIAELERQMRSLDMKIEESLSRKVLTDRLVSQRSTLKTILPQNVVRMETKREEP